MEKKLIVYYADAAGKAHKPSPKEYGEDVFATDGVSRDAFSSAIEALLDGLKGAVLVNPEAPAVAERNPILAYTDNRIVYGLRAALTASLENIAGEDERLHGLVRMTVLIEAMLEAALANVAMLILGAAGSNAVRPGKLQTSTFTLTNLSNVSGTFVLSTAPAVAAPARRAAVVTGYFLDGATTSIPFATLQKQLSATDIEPGESITIGVQYQVPDTNDGDLIITSFNGVAIAAAGSSSATVGNFVVDTVSPQPLVTVTPPTLPASVTPGSAATDEFTLGNASGQPATIALPFDASVTSAGLSVPVAGYTFNGKTVTQSGATPLAALNARLASNPLDDGQSLKVGVTYIGPVGPKGTPVVVTLTATATAGGDTVAAAPVSATTDTIGDPPVMQLEELAKTLVAASRKTLSETAADALLLSTARTIEAIVNESAPIAPVTPQLLAWSLAIAEAMDTISSKELAREQASENVTPTLPVISTGAAYL